MKEDNFMTTLYFIRHAEPNYNNYDDLTRELSPKGLEDNVFTQTHKEYT